VFGRENFASHGAKVGHENEPRQLVVAFAVLGDWLSVIANFVFEGHFRHMS
jgi:hypothetical protein